ncbi:hypothetical protein FDP41_013197 [Naegleria fowleri]|uniref:30S ribosomal protein S17 n=1 Tax=Naegleria fowleri TaxID=5763 RepID=A0A6A5C2D5_NAEFO|nr:uncharacterized protein FDP41_013197 [Naegleria fowleri]KAF0980714.1 hypothetical protein FDP41_013197 [Naegleria fowleri]CAG4712239.1 unnamed protein product [Naegleria fowleri]
MRHLINLANISSSTRLVGTVVSKKMEKTGVLLVPRYHYNNKYGVLLRKYKKIFYHDETNETDVGDIIQIMHQGRKLSKNKSFAFDNMIVKNVVASGLKQQALDAAEAQKLLLQIEQQLLTENPLKVKISQERSAENDSTEQ